MDAKNFYGALDDFDFALKRLPAEAQVDRARLLSGAWQSAVLCCGHAGLTPALDRLPAAGLLDAGRCVFCLSTCCWDTAFEENANVRAPPGMSRGPAVHTCSLLSRRPPCTPAGRGLAYEGLGDWVAALKDYNSALQVAEAAGQLPDPYVLNSRGNCHSSLGAPGAGCASAGSDLGPWLCCCAVPAQGPPVLMHYGAAVHFALPRV